MRQKMSRNKAVCVKFDTVCKANFPCSNLTILHLAKFFYTTSGCDGCGKYQVCLPLMKSFHMLYSESLESVETLPSWVSFFPLEQTLT